MYMFSCNISARKPLFRSESEKALEGTARQRWWDCGRVCVELAKIGIESSFEDLFFLFLKKKKWFCEILHFTGSADDDWKRI